MLGFVGKGPNNSKMSLAIVGCHLADCCEVLIIYFYCDASFSVLWKWTNQHIKSYGNYWSKQKLMLEHNCLAEFLMAKFSELYPGIKVSRPGRFLETVRRINAPIKSGKLQVDEQSLYLEREWIPRICNPSKG